MEENVTNRLLGEMMVRQHHKPERRNGPLSRLARALERGAEGARQGFGQREIGMPAELRTRYPGLAVWQPIVGTVDIAGRSIPAALRGTAGLVAGAAEAAGMSESSANRLQRDLSMIGNTFESREPSRMQRTDVPPSNKALSRFLSEFQQGFGGRELGMPAELRARYPGLWPWQPLVAAPADLALRTYQGLLRGAGGFIAGLSEASGVSETEANRRQREWNAAAEILGSRRLGRW
jgi:hypothetical protein